MDVLVVVIATSVDLEKTDKVIASIYEGFKGKLR